MTPTGYGKFLFRCEVMNFDMGDAIEAAPCYKEYCRVVIAECVLGCELFEFVEIGCVVLDSLREKKTRLRARSPRVQVTRATRARQSRAAPVEL